MDGITIRVTDAFYPLQEFFHRNNLEINLEQHEPMGLIRMWEAVDEGGQRLGATKLENRSGELVLSGIAVEEAARHRKLGSALLETALAHCRTLGCPRLLLVARAPAFFKRAGFQQLPMEDYGHITKCYTCTQRGSDCFPELLYMDL